MVWRHRRRKSKMKVVLLFVKTNWKSKLRQTRSLPYNPACLHWLKEWEREKNVVALHLVAFLGELIYITVQRQASPCLFMQVCGTPCTPADLKRSNSTNQQPKRQTWSCGHNRTARKRNRKQKNTHFPCWIELFFVSSSNLKGFSSASPHHVRWSHNGSRITRHSCFFVAMKTLVAGCEFLSKRFLNRAGDCVSEEETISLRCRRERAENASQKPCASTQRVDCTVEGVKMPSLSGI